MPVTGLPAMLESILNNILKESQLSSFKLCGDQRGSKTVLVIRFEAMADMSMSTQLCSTSPATFRKKSPSQIRRDRIRQLQYKNKKTVTEEASATTRSTTTTAESTKNLG